MTDKPIERMTDAELRAALDACDFDGPEYEQILAEIERRNLDV
jgi:hypothetical protein